MYNPTYHKIVDDTNTANSNTVANKIVVSHIPGQIYTDIIVSCLLDYGEPSGQAVFDNSQDLNGQFVLFKLLQKLKYPCRQEDFYILKTREKMLEHDQIWKKICLELKWTYIPTV